jgi:hypothetical protein
MIRDSHMTPRRRDDQGAMLVIALVFIFAIGIALGAITEFARGSLVTAANVHSQRSTEINAENATTAAIQNVRVSYDPNIYSSATGTACLPPGTWPMAVYCVGSNSNRNSRATRTVSFFTCPSGTAAATCTTTTNPSTELYAQVVFDDVIPTALPPNNNLCGPTAGTITSCGLSMSMTIWDVRTADN